MRKRPNPKLRIRIDVAKIWWNNKTVFTFIVQKAIKNKWKVASKICCLMKISLNINASNFLNAQVVFNVIKYTFLSPHKKTPQDFLFYFFFQQFA